MFVLEVISTLTPPPQESEDGISYTYSQSFVGWSHKPAGEILQLTHAAHNLSYCLAADMAVQIFA